MDEAQNYESKMPAYLLWTKRVRVVQGAMRMVRKGQAMTPFYIGLLLGLSVLPLLVLASLVVWWAVTREER